MLLKKRVVRTKFDIYVVIFTRATNPVVLRNAKFGQSSTRGRVDDLGCIGWEDHLQQCVIHDGGTCTHSSDAAVQCTSKIYQVTAALRGHIWDKEKVAL